MIKKAILIMLFFCDASIGQVCPSAIEVERSIKVVPPGWDGAAKPEVAHLISFSIVFGPIFGVDNNPPAELVPERAGSDYFWKFNDKVGQNEMWMTCVYANSSSLRTRIRSDAVECFMKSDVRGKKGGENKGGISAMCVGLEKKK